METSTITCSGTDASGSCPNHYHAQDPIFKPDASNPRSTSQTRLVNQNGDSISSGHDETSATAKTQAQQQPATPMADCDPDDRGFKRIVRNFTPSWFIITMSTGVVSIVLHQLPYNGHWLEIISIIFFVLNVALFLLFSFISALRYILYPEIFPAVLRHPHQSLFVATFPVGLATLINMIILVCVPAWGSGMAIFAWVLWWIDSVLALTTCFHLTFVIMSHHRPSLAEMTALYLIPIVAIVIAASSGALVGGAIPDPSHRLWTLLISYVFWAIGTPLSWIILTLYFLRMTTHKPLMREVIVSLLLPVGPLSLSGFSIIAMGKLAKAVFPVTGVLPAVARAGDTFYLVGVLAGLVLWGFSIVWFVVSVIMMAVTGGFPFNMGWWGFVFPVGIFTLLTISLGEELPSKFFDVLSCVLAVICVIMWLVIAARTVQRSITGKMFFAPCLGTDLYLKRRKEEKIKGKAAKEDV